MKIGSTARPEGLNTVSLLKIGSSNLGIGPQHTMNIAEHLYLNGYITYPRTESTSYPKTFEFGSIISALKKY
jgi:DNA topoisomerase-3